MTTTPIAQLRKQQRICFAMAPLAAFMGGMKALGIFAVGAFPWYVEGALSVFLLIYAISLTLKIRKLEADQTENDKRA